MYLMSAHECLHDFAKAIAHTQVLSYEKERVDQQTLFRSLPNVSVTALQITFVTTDN